MLNYYKDYAYLGVQYTGVAHRYGVNGKISGNMAALSELRDCAVVVHGPVGCGFHYRYSMRSSFSPYYNLESTALNNSDVVFSGEGKLRETLKRVLDRQPEMIAVVSTCVADVLGEDVQGIVNDFASHNALGKTKKIITVNSEIFSHPDKISFMKRLKERVWNNGNKNIKSDAQFCGCGFIEVLNTLVDQVMEYQPVVPNSVNLESFAWGYGGTEKMQGVIDMLQRIGITVNTILPTGGYEQIRTAPRAQLNVARRIRWAQRMQNRFGTEYVHFPNLGEWAGVKGIEEFYCKIAEHFDKEYVAKKIIAEEFAKHEYDIEAAKRHLSSFSYGLVTSVISEIPDTIELYEQEYRMPLKFIALMLPESYQAEARLDDATMEKMFQNIKDTINATGTKAVFMLNPTEKELLEAASKVDCLVGNGLLRIKNLNTPCLASNAEVRYLDFANYAKALHNMALQVGKGAGTSKLLWHLLDINKEYYPITNDANALASREMWSRMWRKR